MKSIAPKLRTIRFAKKAASAVGIVAVLFFAFIYLFPWIKNDTGSAIAAVCLGILALYAVVFAFWIRREAEPDAAQFFLITVIPLSVIFLILFPHNTFVDSKTHFIAINRLSNILLGKEDWVVRADDLKFMNDYWPDVARPTTKGFEEVISSFSWRIGDETLVDIVRHEDKMKYYSIVSYLPEVIGFTIARLLKLGTVPAMYLSRLFMNVFYVFACYRAIKIMPYGKFAIAFTALLPETLHLAAAFTYDGMAVSCALCFLASCFAIADSVKHSKPDNGVKKSLFSKELIRCMIWAFMLGSVKGGGYFFLLLPLTLLCASRKKLKSFIRPLIIIGSGLLSVLIFNVIATYGISLFQLKGSEGFLSTSFAYKNPLSFLIMTAYSYVQDAEILFLGVTGGMLSWGDFVVDDVFVVALILAMFAYLVFEKDDGRFTRNAKKIFVLSILLTVIITPAMLLRDTAADSRNVYGLQGRYFTPVVPLIMILITKYKLHMRALSATDGRVALKIRRKLLTAVTVIFCVFIYLMLNHYFKQ